MRREEILALATDDYQHRRGGYPESGEADTIDVYEDDWVIAWAKVKGDNDYEL